MNNTGGAVDVWVVAGIEEQQLLTTDSGFSYCPARIPRGQIALAQWPEHQPEPAAARRRHKDKQRKKKPRAGK
jgi:hypothetical protein